ncbi:MAG TPA: Dabb family protein [Burkholderiaceae bacterium]|nr:Dabb family protein [Burkholderiaceae bacterium]
MFHHIVLMRFGNEADQAFHAKVEAFADAIRDASPRPLRYIYRRNTAARSGGLDWAIVSAFRSSAEHDAYQASPLHQEMKAFMTPCIMELVACDLDEAGQ